MKNEVVKWCVFSLTLLLVFSCKENGKEAAATEPTLKNPVIIIDHQMDSLDLFIRDMPSFENLDSNVLSYRAGLDTVVWKKNEEDLIRISSKINETQTILLKPNDTLRIQFKDSVITLSDNAVYWDKVVESNQSSNQLDSIQRQISNLRGRYFTLVNGPSDFMTFMNEYEIIKLDMANGGHYDRELISKEIDSVKKLVLLKSEALLLELENLTKKKDKKKITDNTAEILRSKIISDYASSLAGWSRNVQEQNALNISIKTNEINAAPKDGFLLAAVSDPTYFNKDILKKEYGTSMMHSYLNILQEKHSYATRTQIKSKFHKTYFELPGRLDGEMLKAAQSTAIHKMMSWNEPWSEIKKCYDDYMTRHGSDKYIQSFENQNAKKLDLKTEKISAELIVANSENQSLKIDELLASFEGKPIYIDFWASWCAPCLDAMPDSKKLESKLGDKVHFLYISTDTNENNWSRSAEKLKLPMNKSYIALNVETSAFIKKFKLYEIPRYLLIDAKGNIINDRATSPDDPELEVQLRGLISEL